MGKKKKKKKRQAKEGFHNRLKSHTEPWGENKEAGRENVATKGKNGRKDGLFLGDALRVWGRYKKRQSRVVRPMPTSEEIIQGTGKVERKRWESEEGVGSVHKINKLSLE